MTAFKALLLGSVATIACASSAQAATLTYDLRTSATSESGESYSDGFEVGDRLMTLDGAFADSSVSSFAFASGSAELAVDPAAGLVRFGSRAESTYDAADENNTAGRAFTDFRLSETFLVSGSGLVTFSVAVDGFLSKSAAAFVNSTSAFSVLRLGVVERFSVENQDSFSDELTTAAGATLAIDEVLTASLEMIDGETLTFDFRGGLAAFTRANEFEPSSSAEANFLSTARIAYVTAPGMTLTPSDGSFLSGTTVDEPIGAVPLPAGLPLLLAGLGALGLARRRRG